MQSQWKRGNISLIQRINRMETDWFEYFFFGCETFLVRERQILACVLSANAGSNAFFFGKLNKSSLYLYQNLNEANFFLRNSSFYLVQNSVVLIVMPKTNMKVQKETSLLASLLYHHGKHALLYHHGKQE